MGTGAPAGHRRLDGSQCRDRGRRRHQSGKAQSADAAPARRRETGAAAGHTGLEARSLMLRKRSFSLSGHRTSVALEAEFWAVLVGCAAREGISLAGLVA